MDKENFQESQLLEQNLHSLILQKQSFEIELAEVESSLKELETSGDEVFKIIGQLMLKTDKQRIKNELSHKKEFLISNKEKLKYQEEVLIKELEKLKQRDKK